MEIRTAYCATCDRPVRVVVQEEPPPWPSAEATGPTSVVCLEHGDTCTGSMCPVFDVPTAQMREKLEAYRQAPGG